MRMVAAYTGGPTAQVDYLVWDCLPPALSQWFACHDHSSIIIIIIIIIIILIIIIIIFITYTAFPLPPPI